MLLTVLPLLQFCVKAFGDYAAEAEVVDILRGCVKGALDCRHLRRTDGVPPVRLLALPE